MNTMNALAARIHAQNVARGWWADMNRCVYQTLQLVSTELAEATEGERKNLMDDHLPHRKMGEVELADAAIRLFDLSGRYGWEYVGARRIYWDDLGRLHQVKTIAGRHLLINMAVCRLAEAILEDQYPMGISKKYTDTLNLIFKVAESQGYDVMGAIEDKLAYNETRQDHTPEARAAVGGKKF